MIDTNCHIHHIFWTYVLNFLGILITKNVSNSPKPFGQNWSKILHECLDPCFIFVTFSSLIFQNMDFESRFISISLEIRSTCLFQITIIFDLDFKVLKIRQMRNIGSGIWPTKKEIWLLTNVLGPSYKHIFLRPSNQSCPKTHYFSQQNFLWEVKKHLLRSFIFEKNEKKIFFSQIYGAVAMYPFLAPCF